MEANGRCKELIGKSEMVFFLECYSKTRKKLFKSMEKTWAALQGDLAWAGGCSVVEV